MSTGYNNEIARLIPANELARRLFSQCYVYCLKGDPWHLNFMISTGQEELKSDEPVESSTEYETGSENDATDRLQHIGYFTISFGAENLPQFPPIGWRVGRGTRKAENRSVDILLTDPKNSGSKSLAGIHFRLSLNPQSGFLMLNPDSDKAILERYVGSEWRPVKESCVIYEKSTVLRAGECEYRLNYAVEEEHKEAFIKARNTFVKEYCSSPKGTDRYQYFKYPPGSDAQVFAGRCLKFGTWGSGTFGFIDQGLDLKTGNVLAIKEIRLKDARDWYIAKRELDIGMRFEANETGIVHTLGSFCEHGHINKSCSQPERFYMYMPLGRSDLSKLSWFDTSISREQKLHLLKEPLQGLQKLHALGYMHRDIRPQNTIILSYKPPCAALCDFGKTIHGTTSKDTAIGPIHTCAPEVWRINELGPYDNRVDLWAYGYMMAIVLGYPGDTAKITQARWQSIRQTLRCHVASHPEDTLLVELVLALLEWEPHKRLTAEKALQHACWNPGQARNNELALPSSKRVKISLSDGEAEPTQAFSEETRALIHNSVSNLP